MLTLTLTLTLEEATDVLDSLVDRAERVSDLAREVGDKGLAGVGDDLADLAGKVAGAIAVARKVA